MTLKPLLILLTTSSFLIGCSNSEHDHHILKVGTTGTSYPNSYQNDGKLTGFDVEVVEHIAKKLNYQVQWVNSDFSGLMGQLESNRIDTVANVVAITPQRKARYSFSAPYSIYSTRIVTHDTNKQINTFNDLTGKTVSSVLGSNNIKVVEEKFGNKVKIVTYETRDAAANAAITNKVDSYVNSGPILSAEIKNKHVPFKFVGEPFNFQKIAFPFNKDQKSEGLKQNFNAQILEMKKDGSLKQLSEKYFGQDISNEVAVQTIQ